MGFYSIININQRLTLVVAIIDDKPLLLSSIIGQPELLLLMIMNQSIHSPLILTSCYHVLSRQSQFVIAFLKQRVLLLSQKKDYVWWFSGNKYPWKYTLSGYEDGSKRCVLSERC